MRFIDRKEEQQMLTDTFGGKWTMLYDTNQNDIQVLWLNEELKATILKHEKGLALYPLMEFSYQSAEGNELFRKQTVKFRCGLVTLMITKDITDDIPQAATRALFQGLRLSVWPASKIKNDDSCLEIEVDCPGALILLIELIIQAVKLGELAVIHNLKKWVADNEDDSC